MPYYPVENTHKAVFQGAGKFHMPIIKPETDIRIDKLEWIPFDKIQKTKPGDRAGQGVHFYCVDRAFEAVWRQPDRYIPLLQQFGAVCSPDFSMYRDHPEAVQIWSMYKRHSLTAYWQMHSIKVIPTLEWVWPESYEWCFDGEPRNAIVSISSCGCIREKLAKTLFTMGCQEAIRRLNPTQVLWYGKPLPDMDFNATVIKSEYNKVMGRYYDGRVRRSE